MPEDRGASETSNEPDIKSDHVLLTDRDLELMVALHDHVVLSFAQIHERFFPGRTWGTTMNRLRRIESKGWIERTRIPRMKLFGRSSAAGVVFQLSNGGRKIVSKLRPDVEIFDRCPSLNLFQLDHDLLIADIADYFRGKFKGYQWINGRYVSATAGINKIPDAILRKPGADCAIAIELELNGKSSRRYREILANLKSSKGLERVIFVTAGTSIGRKIMSEIKGFPVQVGHRFRSDFFEFVRLDECIKQEVEGSPIA